MFSEEQVSKFNDLDFTIYNYILEHSDKIQYMTIRELANEAHVSTATITRFVQKLDCDGYTEFKVHFKLYLKERSEVMFSNDITDIEAFLQRVRTPSYQREIEKVATVLANHESLIFVGMGNSGVMATYAARYFSSVGKFSVHVDNPMYRIEIENPESTVVVVFSVDGEMQGIFESINALRLQGTTVVSITNSKNSSIAKISNFNIASYVQKERNKNVSYQPKIDVTSQVPVIFLIETLAKEVYKIKEEKKQVK